MISMTISASALELRDGPLPDGLIPTHGMWPWWVGAGLVAVLALILWRLLRPRRPAAADPLESRHRAYVEALAALDAAQSAGGVREAAVQASLILRKYLSLAAADPALFETHEEFMARHHALSALTAPARSAAADGFARLARLKYGPGDPVVDSAALVSEARTLLETLHRGFAA
jgi:4-amino-4-deoxy-L-arabinose transferase-like glycosyltransferase